MAAIDVLLGEALRADPTRPLLTCYYSPTGERAELSAATLAGWVAKTAGLVQDELALEPGDRVAVRLPAHWQTAAILLGCWAAGAVLGTDPAGSDVTFCDEAHLDAARDAGPGQIVALSLAPLGQPFREPPADAIDYAAVVPGQPDVFVAYAGTGDDAPALACDGGTLSAAAVVAESRRSAERQELSATDRVLSTRRWDGFEDWRDGFLAPLAAGASIVLCVDADPATLPRLIETERVTIVLTDSDADPRSR